MAGNARPQFVALQSVDGYQPIEDHGLIGDGATAALVARDGSIPWLCVPRFDSPPLFCQILDRRRGGSFVITPEGLTESRQHYVPDTGILVTDLRCPDGTVSITDAMTFHPDADLGNEEPTWRGELLRRVRALDGRVRLRVALDPFGGAELERGGAALRIRCQSQPGLRLTLRSSVPLDALPATLELPAGDELTFSLCWGDAPSSLDAADETYDAVARAWRRWLRAFSYDGPQADLVRRSAITLKLLDYVSTGAIVAAPTSSLPEAIGGVRNWDYRYAWVRDVAFSVYALRRIGLDWEAEHFLRWVLRQAEAMGRPHVLYGVEGDVPTGEYEDPILEGYRRSAPVRWGNAAAEQRQHDVFGEIVDCAYQWTTRGGRIDDKLWSRLRPMIERARREWREPDHGIWEVRTLGRPFTYSAAMCQVALDRGARIAERFGLPGDVDAWRADAAYIRERILSDAWDERLGALRQYLDGGGLDAAVLALPLRRVVAADHPRVVATVEAVQHRLGAGKGLLYRYLPDESPDGLPGHEGAFPLCSFWLVDNLALQGRLDEAMDLYESLCGRAGPLGLLPEQIDPSTGAFLGNYPQAFSHVGVISSGVNLARLSASR